MECLWLLEGIARGSQNGVVKEVRRSFLGSSLEIKKVARLDRLVWCI